MGETHITATELARSLSDVLGRVKYLGETFVIERGGEPIAELRRPAPSRGRTPRELAEVLNDLAMPGEGFAEDLERIRAEQGQARDPWPS